MDFINNDDKNYWEQVLMKMNREDDNSARKYRRHNKSLEAMGEKTVITERRQQHMDDEYKAFDALLGFIDTIDNEKLLTALKKLKPIELQIIMFRFEHKMQVSEIAKALDKGNSTISERLGRIMDKLINELNK